MTPAYQFSAPKNAYALAWPREVLRGELQWLLRSAPSLDIAAVELVLQEAFISDEPRDEFASLGGFSVSGVTNPGRTDMLRRLLDVIDALPTAAAPRLYWNQRHNGSAEPPEESSGHGPQVTWTNAIHDLLDRGYFSRAAPEPCIDGDERPRDEVMEERLQRLLGISGLWPLRPGTWDENTFYSLVEALGDLVARPRSRTWHDFSRCGWHYGHFATTPGQALYRSQVNELLLRARTGLQLADDGEDAGRLVRVAGDDRQNLLHRLLDETEGTDQAAVAHAAALFRARAAGREEKRSAVVVLARLLEGRRALLKAELLRKDEGALFQIANEFDVRHRQDKQRADYDEAFLEWMFWWYLATIELTNRMIARRPGA